MSDRSPESDWEQPRPDQSRGGQAHYSGTAGPGEQVPLAASSWTRNRRVIVPIAISVLLFIAGLVVFVMVDSL